MRCSEVASVDRAGIMKCLTASYPESQGRNFADSLAFVRKRGLVDNPQKLNRDLVVFHASTDFQLNRISSRKIREPEGCANGIQLQSFDSLCLKCKHLVRSLTFY